MTKLEAYKFLFTAMDCEHELGYLHYALENATPIATAMSVITDRLWTIRKTDHNQIKGEERYWVVPATD